MGKPEAKKKVPARVEPKQPHAWPATKRFDRAEEIANTEIPSSKTSGEQTIEFSSKFGSKKRAEQEIVPVEPSTFEKAKKLLNVYLGVEGLMHVARTITGHTLVRERPPVTAARAEVRNAQASLTSKLFLAAALAFAGHKVADQTTRGNTEALAVELNDGSLDGVAREGMTDLTRASSEYLKFEGEVQEGLSTLMRHVKRDVDAIVREEMAQNKEADVIQKKEDAATRSSSVSSVARASGGRTSSARHRASR